MKRVVLVVSVLLAVFVLGVVGYLRLFNQEVPPVQSADPPGQITATDLEAAAATRVFFGHQSVGGNVIGGIPAAYSQNGATAPDIVQSSQPVARDSVFAHDLIGQNTDPASKLTAFRQVLDSGVGDSVDVALMKFCYVDITADTDVTALFEEYRSTMAALQRDYPDVSFIYVTTPLTTERGWKASVKALLGKDDGMGPADNAAREQFNTMMRQEYGDTGRLYDLAAVESTAPDGTRITGSVDGRTYYALHDGYAADPGHLNSTGSDIAAAELLKTIADATRDVG
jgi:hypothetical protein